MVVVACTLGDLAELHRVRTLIARAISELHAPHALALRRRLERDRELSPADAPRMMQLADAAATKMKLPRPA